MSGPAREPAVGGRAGILLVALLVIPTPAFAYIDPLSGSVFLQVLAAGTLGALFLLKTFWRRLIAFARDWRDRLLGR